MTELCRDAATTSAAGHGRERPHSVLALRWRRFRRHPAGLVSLVVLTLLVLFCLSAAPLESFLEIDAARTNLIARYQPPSIRHWLGTDEAGRDILVRLMYGGQISLLVALFASVIGAVFGVGIGLTAGYFGGRLDAALMRFTDGVLALPLLPLLIVFGAVDLTKLGFSSEFAMSQAAGFWRIILIIAFVDWTVIARLVRAATLSVKEHDYVRAARASGAGAPYLITAHVLPNIAMPIIVAFTLTAGRVILLESVLSFLGYGIMPPAASWGSMLNNAQEFAMTAPALAIYPGLMIFITVIAVNFLGEALQHAFDPRSDS
ncbi:MAG TPA: ABC transporter permease [Rhodospirillales bacterium]|nr:ABC transporter permease [Rhodospirillales bacterium]